MLKDKEVLALVKMIRGYCINEHGQIWGEDGFDEDFVLYELDSIEEHYRGTEKWTSDDWFLTFIANYYGNDVARDLDVARCRELYGG